MTSPQLPEHRGELLSQRGVCWAPFLPLGLNRAGTQCLSFCILCDLLVPPSRAETKGGRG